MDRLANRPVAATKTPSVGSATLRRKELDWISKWRVSKWNWGTICPLDGVSNNVSDSVSLTIRGTQTVQVDGPPTELAVPQNGMGDQPRLLDPFILSKFFLYGTKLNIFECFPPETPCDDCNFSVGVVGPAKREWRISAKQLFGERDTLRI